MLCEMQTASYKIWTQVIVSISYYSDHNECLHMYVYLYTHTQTQLVYIINVL